MLRLQSMEAPKRLFSGWCKPSGIRGMEFTANANPATRLGIGADTLPQGRAPGPRWAARLRW
jgi:hypothetical protein